MPVRTLGVAPTTIIVANKKRKLLSLTNTHASAIAYISDKAQPTADSAKWILYPYETIFFRKTSSFPERAYFGVSDTADTVLQVGFQNER